MTPAGDVHIHHDDAASLSVRRRPRRRAYRARTRRPTLLSRAAATTAAAALSLSFFAVPQADATEQSPTPSVAIRPTGTTSPAEPRPTGTTITATPNPTRTRPKPPPRPITPAPRPTTERPPATRVPAPAHGGQPARPAPPSASSDAGSPLTVRIGQVTPAIADPKLPVTVTVNLTNTSSTPARDVVVRIGSGDSLRSRAELATFLRGSPELGAMVSRVNLPLLPAGRSTAVTVTLDQSRLPMPRSYGVLAMAVQVSSSLPQRSHPWVLPYHQRNDYQPTRLAILAPVVAPPDPALYAENPATSDVAWRDALKAGSPLDSLAQAAKTLPITPVIDEGLLPPPSTTQPPGNSTPTTSKPNGTTSAAAKDPSKPAATTSTAPPPSTATSVSDAARLAYVTTLLANTQPWMLPRRDPDLGALLTSKAPTSLLSSLVGRTFPLPATSAESNRRPTTAQPRRVVWLEGKPLSPHHYGRLSTDLGTNPPQLAVVPSSMLTSVSLDDAVKAVKKTAEGLTVLAYDEPLSTAVTQATADNGVEQRQRVLADTALQVGEAPQANRTVALSIGRDAATPFPVLKDLLTNVVTAPWISVTDPEELLHDAAPPQLTPRTGDDNAPTYAQSPVDQRAVHVTTGLLSTVDGLASVIRGNQSSTARLDDRIGGLTSTVWRGRVEGWRSARSMVETLVAQESAKVRVSTQNLINFVAEKGEIRFTVLNSLGVEVSGVVLKVETNEKPSRLRVLGQPLPVTIRPHAAAMVRVPLEAVGAGVATLDLTLMSPNNVPIGKKSQVKVKVQPTKGWVLLGGGVILGVVFVAGLYRALRRAPRVTEPSVAEQEKLSSGALPVVADQDAP